MTIPETITTYRVYKNLSYFQGDKIMIINLIALIYRSGGINIRKILFIVFLLLTFSGSRLSAQENYKNMYRNYRKAINMLQRDIAVLPGDSLLINSELKRVKADYKMISDSLKNHAPATIIAGFETQRLINMAYTAQSIQELKQQQGKLFQHLGQYIDKLSNPDSVQNEVAKCLVNSYESKSIWFEDTLLHHVTAAMEQHIDHIQAGEWSIEKKQAFVNMYAAQYYKRGIVSMAEPVFRHFRNFYRYESPASEQLLLSKDYELFSASLQPAGTKLSRFIPGKSMIIVVNRQSPFHLIYLITQLRTAMKAYAQTPVILLRDTAQVTAQYMKALRRNLAKPYYWVANLSEKDSKTADEYSSFSYQDHKRKVIFSTENPIDFLEWLEKPLVDAMEQQKEQRQINYKKIKARKDSIANLAKDTSIKYEIAKEQINITCRGSWKRKPEVRIKTYHYTKSTTGKAEHPHQLALLEVYDRQAPIYSITFFPLTDKINITLTATPRRKIKASFGDVKNQGWQQLSQAIDSLMNVKRHYSRLLTDYPLKQSGFLIKLKQRRQKINSIMSNQLQNVASVQKSLIKLRLKTLKLSDSKPAKKISYKDINEYYPVSDFDSVIWRSPYYKNWLDAWLVYGSGDIVNAIDQVMGFWKVVPDSANRQVGQYIWDKLNAQGRFDALVHLDTTWLQGCADTNNTEIKKRIKGYKRMAPGKKAPNIRWQDDNGKQMELYSIEADTIIVVFWSDDCRYCEKKLPEIYRKYKDNQNVKVIAVAVDKDESTIKTGRKYMPLWYHVWTEEGWEDSLIELYNISGTPEMYILNRDFRILKKTI